MIADVQVLASIVRVQSRNGKQKFYSSDQQNQSAGILSCCGSVYSTFSMRLETHN